MHSSLSQSQSLAEIYIRRTKVTDDGLMHLAKIATLKRILVTPGSVTPQGIQRFKTIRPDVAVD